MAGMAGWTRKSLGFCFKARPVDISGNRRDGLWVESPKTAPAPDPWAEAGRIPDYLRRTNGMGAPWRHLGANSARRDD
jgi:hypothetical protein